MGGWHGGDVWVIGGGCRHVTCTNFNAVAIVSLLLTTLVGKGVSNAAKATK